MDQAWVDAVLEKLGKRYKLGNPADSGGFEVLYRFGKAEFRPTRLFVGGGDGRRIDLTVDFRIPKDTPTEAADPLVDVLIGKSLAPREFEKTSDDTSEMTTESGKKSGFVRSLRFTRPGPEALAAAKLIRAIVESIDLPVVLGVHDEDDLIAREPRPEPKKPNRAATDPMERWEYTLCGGLLKSLTAVVDPNVRTLVVVERKLVSTRDVSETIKLAHVEKLVIEREGGDVVLVAKLREGDPVRLAKGRYADEFVATAERLANKVMIGFEGA